MAGIAIVFPGQGTQESGMGVSLGKASKAARSVFERVDVLRPGTSEQCFHGTPEELMLTVNTQPCMWAVEMAAAAALAEAGVEASAVAGFSLGEIAALTFSKAVSFESGFELVCRRAALMNLAASGVNAAMAAVLKLDAETVDRLCRDFEHVWPVNYNCPGQVTVSGLREELDRFIPAVKASGGIAKLLKVSGAFHSPLMAEAAEKFGKELRRHTLAVPLVPLYSNYTGHLYQDNAKELLTRQICSPVRWQTIIENMAAGGIDTFIEAGPGKTLSGLIKRTLPNVRILSVSDEETLRETLEALLEC